MSLASFALQLLNGLASGTNWVFRDESMHMAFAFDVVDTVREEEPELFDEQMAASQQTGDAVVDLLGLADDDRANLVLQLDQS